MKNLGKLILAALVAFASTVSAQTFVFEPASCNAFTSSESCAVPVITSTGSQTIGYNVTYNNRPNLFQFGTLDSLGSAQVDTVTSSPLVTLTESGTPNRQGYLHIQSGTQQTTFHQEAYDPFYNPYPFIGYTGSSAIVYTVTTRCCSSGRGGGQKSTWSINSGAVTVNP